MANTYTELNYHCIWSTKNRQPSIRPEIEKSIWRILAATGQTHGIKLPQVGGIENHVHVLAEIPKTMAVSEALKRIKGGSSKAINQSDLFNAGKFGWQDGYAAFTVSSSQRSEVAKYIGNQRQHHRNQTFEEEFVSFLERHDVEYNPEYLWD